MSMRKREVIALYNFLTSMQVVNEVSLSPEEWKVLSNNRELLDAQVEVIDEERMALIKKYSGETKKGEPDVVSKDKYEEYEHAWIENMQQDIDLKLETISIKNLGEKLNANVGIWEFMKHMVSK